MTNLRKVYDKPVVKPSGLSPRSLNRLLREIAKLKNNPRHMAGVALVEFGMDVHHSMQSLGLSEKDLAERSNLSLSKIRGVLEPPMKASTRATDLSRVAMALGTDVSIRLYNKISKIRA